EFSIKELFLNQASWQKQRSSSLLNSGLGWLEKLSRSEAAPLHSFAEYNWKHLVEKEIIPHQKPRGSWGGYTLSTLFSLVTIDHYYNHDFSQKREIEQQMKKGFSFLQTLYFNTGSSSLQGVLDDGSYWDTALALRALRENGIANEEIQNSAQFLANLQQKNGAFPFGYDFEDYSDVDDTVETVFALENLNLAHYNEKKALKFVANFQNRDFGWGTFDKNNTGNALLRIFTQNFNDSAEMFDISRPDVTGHALELLGHFGYTSTKSPQVAKSIHYLRLQRDKKTMASWMGRWAVNHIFGTSAVITGLRAVGLPSKDPIIQDAIRWLKSIQNKDGGFGETTESYQDIRLLAANKGVSTASQTGWAIMALVDGGEAQSEATSKAVDFLMKQFRENGQSSGSTGFWTDASVTGTGHPGLIYMIYPSYPYTWPLIALGKYMRAVCKVESHPHQNYCENYLRK
ncbi:MAG TPA: prenyltransferase/squalene oxidase repeat-containing protein, partial [Pseudobdellovibrionaceae bacterium]